MTTLLKALIITLCFGPWPLVQAGERARIAIVGDMDGISMGQDGYCGARVAVRPEAWKNILVDGDAQTWVWLKGTVYTPNARHICESDYTFTPAAGATYILRYSFVNDRCLGELFRAVKGQDPVREPLEREANRSCLKE
jgi:hypothetical protein